MKLIHPILFWHPILIGLWISLGFLCLGMSQVLITINRSGQVHREITATAAELAAEEAAFALPDGSNQTHRTASGFSCEFTSTPGAPMQVLVRDRFGAEHTFEYELLPGAMAPVFGHPFSLLTRGTTDPKSRLHSVSVDPPAKATPNQWPWIDPLVDELPADDWNRTGVIYKDASVALRRLPSGTDRPDFILGRNDGTPLKPYVPASGVVRLDGHLWVDRGDKPVILDLEEDLTIVIRGNLYLGRSLQVRGRGRLVLAVLRWRSDMFRDLDLSGRWSVGDHLITSRRFYQGPIEGSGMVYLGLPAGNPVPGHLRLDAALILDGELHVQSPRAEIWGALAVGHGVTGSPEDNVLLPLGILLPDTQRERIPGFQSLGSPRPGILRRL